MFKHSTGKYLLVVRDLFPEKKKEHKKLFKRQIVDDLRSVDVDGLIAVAARVEKG